MRAHLEAEGRAEGTLMRVPTFIRKRAESSQQMIKRKDREGGGERNRWTAFRVALLERNLMLLKLPHLRSALNKFKELPKLKTEQGVGAKERAALLLLGSRLLQLTLRRAKERGWSLWKTNHRNLEQSQSFFFPIPFVSSAPP